MAHQDIFYYRPCLFCGNLIKKWHICSLKLLGGISNGLVIVLQESIHIHKYLGVIMCHYVYNTLKNNLLFTFWKMFFYQVIHIHKVHVWLGTPILVDVASMDLVFIDYGGYGPM